MRDELAQLSYEDAEMLLGEFLVDSLDYNAWTHDCVLTAGQKVRLLDDDALIDLAQALDTEIDIQTASLSGPPREQSPLPTEPLQLFASHLAVRTATVGEVGDALNCLEVDLFVAHRDIEPDSEWQAEIVRRLSSAHGGVAFLHEGFKESQWCAQEVGWLLGRGVPVVSLMFELSPYGPMGTRQGIAAGGRPAEDLADDLLDRFLDRPETRSMLTVSLVRAMRRSTSFRITDRTWRLLRTVDDLGAELCAELLEAVQINNQVHWADSPHDGGRPYRDVVREFLRRQPGANAIADELENE